MWLFNLVEALAEYIANLITILMKFTAAFIFALIMYVLDKQFRRDINNGDDAIVYQERYIIPND